MSDEKSSEVIFKYYLPEHTTEIWITNHAQRMYSIIFDIDEMCRSVLKYEDGPDEGRSTLAQEIRDYIHSEIDLDMNK